MLNLALAPLLLGSSAVACCGALTAVVGSNDQAVRALAEIDRLLAGNPSTMQQLAALERLARARGRVLDAQGNPADLGYDAAHAALALDATIWASPRLAARFLKLPAPRRGAEHGTVRQVEQSRIDTTVTFRAREVAMVYVRSTDRSPVSVTIYADGRNPQCARTSQSGRALCRWRPQQTMLVRITATLSRPAKGAGLELFTN